MDVKEFKKRFKEGDIITCAIWQRLDKKDCYAKIKTIGEHEFCIEDRDGLTVCSIEETDWDIYIPPKNSCSKCGNILSDRWEQHATAFRLDIRCCSQSTSKLSRGKEDIKFSHPIIDAEKSGYQRLIMDSGESYDYKLCMSCHEEFMGIIGDFIRQ